MKMSDMFQLVVLGSNGLTGLINFQRAKPQGQFDKLKHIGH